MIDLTKNLAAVNRRTRASVIRELLKITNRPEVISFAGGLPDPDAFPTDIFADITTKLMKTNARVALQYGPTEGLTELKEQIIDFLQHEEGIIAKPSNILITTASQQGLDLVAKAFIDPSDPVIVSLPTYIGGLQVFKSYGAQIVGVRSDDEGILIDELEKRLSQLKNEEEHYKFIYLVPDFQNPSGVTISQARRRKILSLSREYDVLIIEDSPYRQVRFEGKAPRMLYQLDDIGNVVSLFTFSKTLAPGLRLGFILGHEAIIQKMAILKQTLDLCSSSLSQMIAAEFLKGGHFRPHTKRIAASYKKKKDAMLAALERYMPEGVTWTKPEGGLFLWIMLPHYMNADELFSEAVKENVAYVIGSAFHCDGSGKNTMRLNFSYPTEAEIDEGIKRLAKVVKANMTKPAPAAAKTTAA